MKRSNSKGIRMKLTISLISICLIPLICVSIFSVYQAKSILTRNFKTTSEQTLNEVNTGIQNYFSASSNEVVMMSSNYNFVNIL
jgi:methyl-accepting chemotaxis protein